MTRLLPLLVALLATPALAASPPEEAADPAEVAPPPSDPSPAEPAPEPAAAPEAPAAPLRLEVTSAARAKGKIGLVLAAVATNAGSEDLLLLLSEAHVVPPDSMESPCAADSPRFRSIPVLQIARAAEGGDRACADTERVPKADWALSVMRLRGGESATIVLQVDAAVDWEGPLFARLGLSYGRASDATEKELARAERLGLGFVVAGQIPGGRVVAPGEGGVRVRRAVELFSERAISAPVRIAGTVGG